MEFSQVSHKRLPLIQVIHACYVYVQQNFLETCFILNVQKFFCSKSTAGFRLLLEGNDDLRLKPFKVLNNQRFCNLFCKKSQASCTLSQFRKNQLGKPGEASEFNVTFSEEASIHFDVLFPILQRNRTL